jgi:hypothetical protein
MRMAPSLDYSISSRQHIWRNYEADLLGGFEFMALSDHLICPRKHAVAIVRTICFAAVRLMMIFCEISVTITFRLFVWLNIAM